MNMGGMQRLDNMMGGNPFGKNMPIAGLAAPMGPPQQVSLRSKIANVIRDKQRLLDMDENAAKRILAEHLKNLAEEQGIASGSDATRLVSKLEII